MNARFARLARVACLACLSPVVAVACKTTPTDASPNPTATRPVPPIASQTASLPAPAPRATRLGSPLTAPEVTLAEVAKNPNDFAGRPFTTRGVVTAVCQEMGCWMEIKDSGSAAHLRMHGHSFFVPKDASGRTARIEATLVPEGSPKACGGEEACAGTGLAQLQLDATGVELD